MNQVLHHFDITDDLAQCANTFREAFRVLKPGGVYAHTRAQARCKTMPRVCARMHLYMRLCAHSVHAVSCLHPCANSMQRSRPYCTAGHIARVRARHVSLQ